MKELNNSIYHETGIGLLIRVEMDGIRHFYTQQGLDARIEVEKMKRRDVSQLVEAREELAVADRVYQSALWDFIYRFSEKVLNRNSSDDRDSTLVSLEKEIAGLGLGEPSWSAGDRREDAPEPVVHAGPPDREASMHAPVNHKLYL